MAQITASMVKELREKTGAGMMDCKKVLSEADGNIEKAIDLLREKGLAGAEKKAGRLASEGIVETYIHGGKIAAIVEINSETDFVAKNEEFKEFGKKLVKIARDKVPAEEVEKEKEVLVHQAMNENDGKNIPEDKAKMIAEKKVEGRINKFYSQICLLEQPFIKDPNKSVEELLTDLIAKIGENIKIRRFARFEVGEGLEKKNEDFAEEVKKQMGQ